MFKQEDKVWGQEGKVWDRNNVNKIKVNSRGSRNSRVSIDLFVVTLLSLIISGEQPGCNE